MITYLLITFGLVIGYFAGYLQCTKDLNKAVKYVLKYREIIQHYINDIDEPTQGKGKEMNNFER